MAILVEVDPGLITRMRVLVAIGLSFSSLSFKTCSSYHRRQCQGEQLAAVVVRPRGEHYRYGGARHDGRRDCSPQEVECFVEHVAGLNIGCEEHITVARHLTFDPFDPG